jgi:hypothetical protein
MSISYGLQDIFKEAIDASREISYNLARSKRTRSHQEIKGSGIKRSSVSEKEK